jgi:hypothetical protein
MQLLQAAQEAMKPGRDGLPGITFDEYTYIIERLNAGGNIKEIRLYLSKARKRAEQRNFQEKRALQQQVIEGNKQQAQMRMQQMAMEKDMDTRGKIAVDKSRAADDLRIKMIELNGQYMNELIKQTSQENAAAG